MEVKDIMTKNPACCTSDTNLQEVARLMVEHDCGESPVVESKQSMRLVGVSSWAESFWYKESPSSLVSVPIGIQNARMILPPYLITDRDITCRSVAVGKNPLEMTDNTIPPLFFPASSNIGQ